MTTVVSVSPYSGLPVRYDFSHTDIDRVQQAISMVFEQHVGSDVVLSVLQWLISRNMMAHFPFIGNRSYSFILSQLRQLAPLQRHNVELPMDVLRLIAIHSNITGHPMINLTCKALLPRGVLFNMVRDIPLVVMELLLYVQVTAANELMMVQLCNAVRRSPICNKRQIDAMGDNIIHNMLRAQFFSQDMVSNEIFLKMTIHQLLKHHIITQPMTIMHINDVAVRDFRRNREVPNSFTKQWIGKKLKTTQHNESRDDMGFFMVHCEKVVRLTINDKVTALYFTDDDVMVLPRYTYGVSIGGPGKYIADGTIKSLTEILSAIMHSGNDSHAHAKLFIEDFSDHDWVIVRSADIMPLLNVMCSVYDAELPTALTFADADYMTTDNAPLPYRDIPLLTGDTAAILAQIPWLPEIAESVSRVDRRSVWVGGPSQYYINMVSLEHASPWHGNTQSMGLATSVPPTAVMPPPPLADPFQQPALGLPVPQPPYMGGFQPGFGQPPYMAGFQPGFVAGVPFPTQQFQPPM